MKPFINYLLIFQLLTLIGCNHQNQLSHNNGSIKRSDYFYQIDSLTTPKVYIFNVDSSGKLSKVYYKVSKQSANELEVLIYADNFELIATIKDSYDNYGIKLKDYSMIESINPKSMMLGKVIDSLIFSFDSNISYIDSKVEQYYQLNKNLKMIIKTKFNDYVLTKGKFLNDSIPTLTAKTTAEYEVYDIASNKLLQKFVLPGDVIYGYKYGIIGMSNYFNNSLTKIVLEKIISLDEFEKIKNKRQLTRAHKQWRGLYGFRR